MWIERLTIKGYQRLRGDFHFAESLTIVTGPNESGKSTLRDAIVRALFGFTRYDRQHWSGPLISNCAPWDGGVYGLTALVHTESAPLRIDWSFDGEGCGQTLTLNSENTGEELTDQVLATRGDTTLGRFLLGVDESEYWQVCTVDQAAIGAVESSEPLVDSLRQAAQVGTANVGVDRADELLKGALGGGRIGVRVDNLSSLKNGELRRCEDRSEELVQALEQAAAKQVELVALASTRTELQESRTRTAAAITGMEQELLLSRRNGLGQRVEAAVAAAAAANQNLDDAVLLDPARADAVKGSLATVSALEDRLAPAVVAAEATSVTVAEIKSQMDGLDAELRQLAPYSSLETSAEAEVSDLISRVDELAMGAENQVAQARGGTERRPWIAAAAVAAASVAATFLVGPVALAGVAVAVAVFLALHRSSAAWAETFDRPARRAELIERLATVLAPVASDDAQPVLERAQAYLADSERARRYAEVAGERAGLAQQMSEAAGPVRERQRVEDELEGARALLTTQFAELGIEGEHAAAAAQFQHRQDLDRAAREAAARSGGARESLEAALAGRTYDELVGELEEAKLSLTQHIDRHGELVDAPRPESRVEERLAESRDQENRMAEELGALEQRISDAEAGLDDVPAWRAEQELLDRHCAVIRSAAEAVAIAREELEASAAEAHSRFAPILNTAIEAELPTITDGRYRLARVSEELEITVEAPETGSLVSAEHLSRGTQDQIYLIQRLAILRVLSGAATESAPLLLDDAFAFFDEDRLGASLELLAREAAERQVVLFVDDESICNRLADLEIDHAHIALPAPE